MLGGLVWWFVARTKHHHKKIKEQEAAVREPGKAHSESACDHDFVLIGIPNLESKEPDRWRCRLCDVETSF